MGRLLSIEIDKYNIKIAEVSKKGEMLSILKSLVIKAPFDITEGKLDTEDIDSMAAIIKKELDLNNIKAKRAVFVINSNSIIARRIKLPLLKKSSETLSMVKNELEQLISVDLRQYKIMYKVTKQHAENNNTFYTVYCLPISIYNRLVELSEKLKLKFICLDVSFNCLNKIFSHNIKINNKALNSEHIYAFINIDLNWCSFCVLNKGVNDFSRIFIFDKVRNSEFAAEDEGYYGTDKASDALSVLLEEISKYIRYYYSIDNTDWINKIYIYGISSQIQGISRYFSENLNIEAEKIYTISNLRLDSNLSFDCSLNNYFNSILSLFNNKNDICYCKESLYKYKEYTTAIILIAFILAVSCYVMSRSNLLLTDKTENLNMYIYDTNNVELNFQIEKIKNENLILENLLEEIEIMESMVNNSDVSSYILKEIYNVIPLNTKVTSISIDRNSTQLTCISGSMEEVSIFVKSLRKIEYINKIHVPNVEVNQNDSLSYSYSIVCWLKDVNDK
ncbi:pilus assembly protein PilM [Sedimentibacter sp.]|uniref:pilus assembly protein PilM n=1 Tax=Sedimentibacter sp. TaxID=1960295 RepID=UPI0028A6EE74|nr:pilus assembly protein PilM [Sedimentibacter sp.]